MANNSGCVKVGCIVSFFVFCLAVLIGLFIGRNAATNFSEAQTRAKVSRVLSDLRSYEIAAETFFKDSQSYPTSPGNLTTPISYLSFLGKDPFHEKNDYQVLSNESAFLIYSAGPDKTYQIDPNQDIAKGEDGLKLKSYDATNGAFSSGDIFRLSHPDQPRGASHSSTPRIRNLPTIQPTP